MKNKFNVLYIFFLFIFALIPHYVFAIESVESALNIHDENVYSAIVNDCLIINNNGDKNCEDRYVYQLSNNFSIFSSFYGSDSLPLCYSDIYYYDENNNRDLICNTGFSPDIDKLIKYYPYIIKFDYVNINSNDVYYMFYLYSDIPDYYNSAYGYSFSRPDIMINNFPDNYLLNSSNSIYANSKYNFCYNNDSSRCHLINYYGSEYNLSYGTYSYPNINTLYLYNVFNNNYFDVSLSSNFDLSLIDNFDYSFTLIDDFDFQTDTIVSIPYQSYLLLVPKHNYEFDFHIWTDSNYVMLMESYDSISLKYSTISSRSFNKIFYNYNHNYLWWKWNYSYSSFELSNNVVLKLFNHNSNNNLNVRFNSFDFFYSVNNSTSSSSFFDNTEYINNYSSIYNYSSAYSVDNEYHANFSEDILSLDYIPNLLSSFKSSFIFIGTLITTFFNSLNTELFTYFYILFGLMIIMLIISILK